MSIGMAFTWVVILGVISALFEMNGISEVAIVFATLSGSMLLYSGWLLLEDYYL